MYHKYDILELEYLFDLLYVKQMNQDSQSGEWIIWIILYIYKDYILKILKHWQTLRWGAYGTSRRQSR